MYIYKIPAPLLFVIRPHSSFFSLQTISKIMGENSNIDSLLLVVLKLGTLMNDCPMSRMYGKELNFWLLTLLPPQVFLEGP